MLQPGNHDFIFSVTGTSGGWSDAWKTGVSPNNPLTFAVLPGASHAGALPTTHSFLNVTTARGAEADVWITAAKKEDGDGKEGLAVRLFGVTQLDQPGVILQLGVQALLAGASNTDLIEMNPVPIQGVAGGSSVTLDVGHWAIETIVLNADI